MSDTRPIVILDTNALLDWRVFKDPAAAPIAEAIESGRWRWLACPSMEQEWHQVWPRSYLKAWQPDPMRTLTVFRHAEFVDEPPRGPFRCKDPDDQVFIDLALHVGAAWLFSKDAALLKIARRARPLGLTITSPQKWVADQGAVPGNAAGEADAAHSPNA
jgi:predicted nucleic acid-binding protein